MLYAVRLSELVCHTPVRNSIAFSAVFSSSASSSSLDTPSAITLLAERRIVFFCLQLFFDSHWKGNVVRIREKWRWLHTHVRKRQRNNKSCFKKSYRRWRNNLLLASCKSFWSFDLTASSYFLPVRSTTSMTFFFRFRQKSRSLSFLLLLFDYYFCLSISLSCLVFDLLFSSPLLV